MSYTVHYWVHIDCTDGSFKPDWHAMSSSQETYKVEKAQNIAYG